MMRCIEDRAAFQFLVNGTMSSGYPRGLTRLSITHFIPPRSASRYSSALSQPVETDPVNNHAARPDRMPLTMHVR